MFMVFKCLNPVFSDREGVSVEQCREDRTVRQERSASAMAVATCAHQPREQVRLNALPDVLVPTGIYALFCPTFQPSFSSN